MMDQLMFAKQNRDRIHAIDRSFVPSGKPPLYQHGRVLIGEGRLRKQRRSGGSRSKAFFLFNDLLVYGSIVVSGRWHKNQKSIPLVNIQLEDSEDGVTMKNQWLLRTPRKSFYVAASSPEEKQAWIKHMEGCLSTLLEGGDQKPTSDTAVPWVPDQASAICMRCPNKFTFTLRRHHCRKCGFIVCGACSRQRAVIQHMHPNKLKRVCTMCHSALSTGAKDAAPAGRERRADWGSQDDEGESSGEEEEMEEKMKGDESWAVYVYLNPEHIRP